MQEANQTTNAVQATIEQLTIAEQALRKKFPDKELPLSAITNVGQMLSMNILAQVLAEASLLDDFEEEEFTEEEELEGKEE